MTYGGPTARPVAAAAWRGRFAGWGLLYALLVVYVSIVIGPLGFHPVSRTIGEAWEAFRSTSYVKNGSDQRPDWVANLLMIVPLGFLLTGAFWPRIEGARGFAAMAKALLLGIAFVLAVKFAQLWVPPRTVTINYITAQSVGCLLGVALFGLAHGHLFGAVERVFQDGGRAFAILLGAYSASLFLFYLVPFDFALSGGDLADRLKALPGIVLSLPGAGRPGAMRLAMLAVDTLAMVPVGMLLAIRGPWRPLRSIVTLGLAINAALLIAALFILSAAPFLAALLYRTIGIALGALLMKSMAGQDMVTWRWRLSRAVGIAWPLYLVALLFVSGLLNTRFVSFEEAQALLEPRGFLPFWHYYIVTKAHAAGSLVVHAATYAPIGVLLWLKRGDRRGGAWLAGFVGLAFALVMELGRWLKQGLQPDFSDPVIGAAAAFIAVAVMPLVWRMLDAEAKALAPYRPGAQASAGLQPVPRRASRA